MKFPPEKVTHLNAVERREMAEVKFCHDAGGNAEKFQGSNAEEGLLRITSLWSKAWKEQGQNILRWSWKGAMQLPMPNYKWGHTWLHGVLSKTQNTGVGSQTYEISSAHQETIRPGHRLSDFQRFLTDMALPVLRQSRLRDLRPWLRRGSEGIQNTAKMQMLAAGCRGMQSMYSLCNNS